MSSEFVVPSGSLSTTLNWKMTVVFAKEVFWGLRVILRGDRLKEYCELSSLVLESYLTVMFAILYLLGEITYSGTNILFDTMPS